jgi:hypothetical protein
MKLTTRRMMTMKAISGSQICGKLDRPRRGLKADMAVSPDYVLVVKDKLDVFVDACQKT